MMKEWRVVLILFVQLFGLHLKMLENKILKTH